MMKNNVSIFQEILDERSVSFKIFLCHYVLNLLYTCVAWFVHPFLPF